MFRNKITTLFLLAVVLASIVEVANADFTFGEPTNLGPPINCAAADCAPCISADGLEFYFHRGADAVADIWVARRATPDSEWEPPLNLGPTVNTPGSDATPSISTDGLSLYFLSNRPEGFGYEDLWVTTRATLDDDWGAPINLGVTVNSASSDGVPIISADGLELYFTSNRPGGHGNFETWISTRATTSDPWPPPVNLGPTLNTSANEMFPSISADGLLLFFSSNRSGGLGSWDLYMARRATTKDTWGPPMNLGPTVNSTSVETGVKISADGSMIYFHSNRPGGEGRWDVWQVPLESVVELNGDNIVDATDMCIIVDNWGTDDPLCDIGPMPWGDGIVDVQDLIILAEHLFEEIPPAEPVE